MQTVSIAIRTTLIVIGIAAIATLANRMVADSGARLWLLMNQQSMPGALWAVSAIEHFTYGIVVVLICLCVARGYWLSLFPKRTSAQGLSVCFAIGIVFAMFLNHQIHVFLFDIFFGKSVFTGGAVSDGIAATIFSGLSGYQHLFTFSAVATIIITPFVEELTDRGILFKEAESLPLWQIAVLSFLVFCFSHYAIGGLAKVLAVVPAALLFISIRIKTGSFVYSVAAHVGMNLAALLKLQVF
jgi:membrane protease YdiL (CAAX protease family)